jgi:hypothetical protein
MDLQRIFVAPPERELPNPNESAAPTAPTNCGDQTNPVSPLKSLTEPSCAPGPDRLFQIRHETAHNRHYYNFAATLFLQEISIIRRVRFSIPLRSSTSVRAF